MKIQLYFILLSLALIKWIDPKDAIKLIFLSKDLKVLGGVEGEDYIKEGKTALITNPGFFIASVESEEWNIIINYNSVTLYLQNLNLS